MILRDSEYVVEAVRTERYFVIVLYAVVVVVVVSVRVLSELYSWRNNVVWTGSSITIIIIIIITTVARPLPVKTTS